MVFYVRGGKRNMPPKAAPPRHGEQGKKPPPLDYTGAEMNTYKKDKGENPWS